MNDLTPEDRARALELYRLHFRLTHDYESVTISPDQLGNLANTWLAVEARILTSHECPDVESHSRVQAWNIIAQHPFFSDCYQTEGVLVDAMVAKLDAAHTHTCEPVWRPTTADEIQPGWEVRSRARQGFETSWGIAHHQDADRDWRTEEETPLTNTHRGWTYETTAPETEPDPRIRVVVEWINEPAGTADEVDEDDAIDLLARLDALTEGGQSS